MAGAEKPRVTYAQLYNDPGAGKGTEEDGAAVAVTESGATKEICSAVFAQSRTFSQRHPVI